MEAKTIRYQAKANHQQEAQTEDDDSRVTVHEARQGFTGEHHQGDGDDHRGHHHRQMVNHPDGRDHGVERKDGIQHHYLRDHRPEFCTASLGGVFTVFSFQPLIKLNRGFEQQEQSAEKHDQVAGAKAQTLHAE